MQNLELENLHQKIIRASGDYHVAQANLLDHLQDAERLRLHLHRGFSSMFDYVTKEIGLSESCANNFINVARKSLEVKELKEAIRQGHFGVSKARKITKVLKHSNQKQWLEDLKNKNTREIEKKVASKIENPEPIESLKPIAKNTARLTIDIDDELVDLLDQLKDLVALKVKGKCTTQEAIKLSVKEFITRHDPTKKAERAKKRKEKNDGAHRVAAMPDPKSRAGQSRPDSAPTPVSTRLHKPAQKKKITCHVTGGVPKKRGTIPAWVLHKVYVRDGGQCAYKVKNGRRCTQKRYLHLHHRVPVAHGGKHHPDNLVTLCSAHHRFFIPPLNRKNGDR